MICSAPVLAIFNPNLETRVYTDASQDGIGGIITQTIGAEEKSIAYFSKKTTTDERKLHSFELELLAIVRTLERFRHYLLGIQFTIITDCNAVKNAMSKQSIIPRIARWVLALQEYNFTMQHKQGKMMQHVDALSRNPEETPTEHEQIVRLINEEDWLKEAQDQDEEIKNIKEILLSGDAQNNKQIFKNYDLRGNRIFKMTENGRRWLVPKKCRWQIVKLNHDDIGHFAVEKTLDRIKQRYWFPKMKKFVSKYIRSCLNCLYHEATGGKKPGYLHSIPKYAKPFHTLHIDHLGPFVTSLKGNNYLLVIVDAFTKFVFPRAVPDTKTATVIRELENIFSIFGNPRRIIVDAGTAFAAKEFHDFCEKRGIRLHTTAVGMPRGNGQVERVNRSLLDALATMGSGTSTDNWDINLEAVQQGINSTRHKTTQATPAELMLGINLRSQADRYVDEESDTPDITKLREKAKEKLEANEEKQKVAFDKKRRSAKKFEVGDLVLTRISSISSNNNNSKKLLEKYKGPFKIIEVLPNDRYKVREDIHATRTKTRIPYEGIYCVEDVKPFTLRK